MKKRSFLLLITVLSFFVYSSHSVRTLAKMDNYVDDFAAHIEYGWSEDIQQCSLGDAKSISLASTNEYDTWILRSTDVYNFSNNRTMTLDSYTIEFLNDTKLCKGVTHHSAKLYGYVSAHFANVFGTMYPDSYSGRVYSNYGDVAETPFAPGSNGWVGIAHTNCGI